MQTTIKRSSLIVFWAATLVPMSWSATRPAQDDLVRSIHRIRQDGSGYIASNPAQGFTVRFQEGRAEFVREAGRFSLALAGEEAPSNAIVRDNRIDFARGNVTEWFINDAHGVEQGFTIANRRGSGNLELVLEVSGDYTPALEGGEIVLLRDGKPMMRYAGLRSWDAGGRTLKSHAVVDGSRIKLIVDDRGARYPVTIDPVVQEFTLTASDAVAGDGFGTILAISGDTAILGTPTQNSSAGAAYVFVRSGNTWVQQQKLTGAPSDSFGSSVALDGDTAVVGAFTGAGGAGAVYVFTRSAGVWSQQGMLTVSDLQAGQFLGGAVAINGDTLVAAAPSNIGPSIPFDRGQAFVFIRSAGVWSFQARLLGFLSPSGTPYSEFGASLAISGDTVVIGAPGANSPLNTCGGAVFIFIRVGNIWNSQVRMTAPDIPACNASTRWDFGRSVALEGDTALVGAPLSQTSQAGAAYFFTRSGGTWSLQTKATPSDTQSGDQFGGAVAMNGDSAVIGAKRKSFGANPNSGAAYLFTRFSSTWTQQVRFDPSVAQTTNDLLGSVVGISRDTVLVGVPGANASAGLAYVFRLSNVSLTSSPSGRSFTLSGTGCGAPGAFATPYTGYWSTCTVQWTSPDNITPDTRITFQNWNDAGNVNPRAFALNPDPKVTNAFTGNFVTEYLLTANAIPVSGGTVGAGGWYPTGTTVGVFASVNSGFVFTGFSGALTGAANPQPLLMNGPKSVTAGFSTVPPSTMTASIVTKNGPASSRFWAIQLTNAGPGTAYGAQVFVLSFVQTFGTACTSLPVRLSPATLPSILGTLSTGQSALSTFTLDFSGCPANARFTVNLGYMSNGGASGGLIQLVNQTM